MAGFHAVFLLTLQYTLNHLLIFRDDISGATAARGLTTWDFIHRAGPSRKIGMAPRPSFGNTGILFGARFEIVAWRGRVRLRFRKPHSQAFPRYSEHPKNANLFDCEIRDRGKT